MISASRANSNAAMACSRLTVGNEPRNSSRRSPACKASNEGLHRNAGTDEDQGSTEDVRVTVNGRDRSRHGCLQFTPFRLKQWNAKILCFPSGKEHES